MRRIILEHVSSETTKIREVCNMKSIMERIGEVKEKILRTIWETGKSVTVQEISGKTGLKPRAVNTHLLSCL